MNMKLAGGDFSAVKPLDARNAEIRQLGEAFSYMSGKLSESMETEKRALVMESSLRQARLETLQAQINPHFLFNALNTVRSLSQVESAVQTEAILDALSAFLRYNLEKQDSMVSLADEFAMAEHYLKIQKMRFGKRLNYDIQLGSELSSFRVPSLLVQPLVENSLVHGLESLKDGGSVLLSAYLERGIAVIEISDNGVGMSPALISQLNGELAGDVIIDGSHVGIRNTLKRLKLTDPAAEMMFLENPRGRGLLVRITLSPGS
jgi:sensor histidine kinase YesM